MKNKIFFFLFLLFSMSRLNAQVAIVEDADDPAVRTRNLLKDSQQRNASLDTPQAKAAAQQVNTVSLGNQDIQNQIFNTSGDLFKVVADWQTSDPDFFKKLSENSQDPAFVKKFYEK